MNNLIDVPELPKFNVSNGFFRPSSPKPSTVRDKPFLLILVPSKRETSIVLRISSEKRQFSIFVLPIDNIDRRIALWDIDLSPGTSTFPIMGPSYIAIRDLSLIIRYIVKNHLILDMNLSF